MMKYGLGYINIKTLGRWRNYVVDWGQVSGDL